MATYRYSDFSAQPNYNYTPAPHGNGTGHQYDYGNVVGAMMSSQYSEEQKLGFLGQAPELKLEELYQATMTGYGFQPVTTAYDAPFPIESLNEDNYQPLVEDVVPLVGNAHGSNAAPPPQPRYPPYSGRFQTAQEAKTHRKRMRVPAKSNAPDIERVKRSGRPYWVRRIYEAMIDITAISDGEASIHRERFVSGDAFEPHDLEAAAHHIFDAALAVHERGWNRLAIYHKKVVRGKLMDVSENSLEMRLTRICLCLKQSKATVDDALRGGVTLALLCDNPEARGSTKQSNNQGNSKRSERLKRAKSPKPVVPPTTKAKGSAASSSGAPTTTVTGNAASSSSAPTTAVTGSAANSSGAPTTTVTGSTASGSGAPSE